jgi:hypothetical protein
VRGERKAFLPPNVSPDMRFEGLDWLMDSDEYQSSLHSSIWWMWQCGERRIKSSLSGVNLLGDGDVAEGAEIRYGVSNLGVAGGLAARCSDTTGMIVGPLGFRRRRRADYRKAGGQRRSA